MEHPLKVYYPHGGKHFVAQFWTHNEQNQIVVAKSLSALDRTLIRLIENHSDIQIREILEIDIVSPPKSLCEIAKIEVRRIQVEEFFRFITFYVKELFDNKKQLPDIFKICSKWTPTDTDVSKGDKETHFYCKNCYEKIALKKLSLEEFYDKYHSEWQSVFDCRKPFVDDRAVYSYADPAYRNELWYANANFGHHCSGVTFYLNEDNYINTSPVLFYFHKIKEIDNSKYTNLLKEMQQKQKEKEKLSRDKFAENLKKEKEEKYQKILKIFEE